MNDGSAMTRVVAELLALTMAASTAWPEPVASLPSRSPCASSASFLLTSALSNRLLTGHGALFPRTEAHEVESVLMNERPSNDQTYGVPAETMSEFFSQPHSNANQTLQSLLDFLYRRARSQNSQAWYNESGLLADVGVELERRFDLLNWDSVGQMFYPRFRSYPLTALVLPGDRIRFRRRGFVAPRISLAAKRRRVSAYTTGARIAEQPLEKDRAAAITKALQDPRVRALGRTADNPAIDTTEVPIGIINLTDAGIENPLAPDTAADLISLLLLMPNAAAERVYEMDKRAIDRLVKLQSVWWARRLKNTLGILSEEAFDQSQILAQPPDVLPERFYRTLRLTPDDRSRLLRELGVRLQFALWESAGLSFERVGAQDDGRYRLDVRSAPKLLMPAKTSVFYTYTETRKALVVQFTSSKALDYQFIANAAVLELLTEFPQTKVLEICGPLTVRDWVHEWAGVMSKGRESTLSGKDMSMRGELARATIGDFLKSWKERPLPHRISERSALLSRAGA